MHLSRGPSTLLAVKQRTILTTLYDEHICCDHVQRWLHMGHRGLGLQKSSQTPVVCLQARVTFLKALERCRRDAPPESPIPL